MSVFLEENTLRLEDLRLDFNLKQGDIAKMLNVKRNTYSKWENCINDMPLEKCSALADFYKVSIDYLLGLSNSKEFSSQGLHLNLLPQRLFEERKLHGYTQEEVSKKVGFTQRAYSNYETGKRPVTTLKLLSIAQFFHISMDYLVGRTSHKEVGIKISL